MVFFRRSQLLVLIVAACLLSLAWWLPELMSRKPLSIAIGIWPGSETLILARERGLLDEREVRLVEMTWDSAAMRALATGAVQAAVLSVDEVLRLVENGHDVRVVLIFDQSISADALVAKSSIARLADLKNRRVGVDVRAMGMTLLASALEEVGLSLKDVQTIPLTPTEMVEAFQGGEVDAVVCPEPWLSNLKQGDNNVLALPKARLLLRCLVVLGPTLQAKAETLRGLLAAHFAVQDELHDETMSAGMAAVLRREKQSGAEFAASIRGLKLMTREDNWRLLAGPQPELNLIAGQIESHMVKHELLSGPVEADTLPYPAFLPK